MSSSIQTKPAGDMLLRQVVIAIFLLCLGVGLVLPQTAAAKPNNKYASIVIDADTGLVISERHADKSLHPASLTKVMTLLLMFEALESGQVRLNDKIRISQRAASQQPSKIGLSAGSTIRVEDAILSLVTKSANDISVAIAEHLGGTEDRFALRMTRRARDIGMRKTTFKNAHGLHHPQQVSSARDMATLARYVITRYPNYYRYFSTKQFTYRGVTYTNHNRLMNSYPGMDGFKTGFINASGFNLIASARKNGRRVIGVVFGGRTWKTRNDHMAEILNAGFSKIGQTRYAAGDSTAIPVANLSKPLPLPVPKPSIGVAGNTAPQSVEITTATTITADTRNTRTGNTANYTSLAALDQKRTAIAANTLQLPEGYEDRTEQAIADVQSAINSGAYSELTGEGDFDTATSRRLEAGMIAAAVYKGEHDRVKHIQAAAAMQAAGITPQDIHAGTAAKAAALQKAAIAPAASRLWSVQIGAYNSRVATDDALRKAQTKLPQPLNHARPAVVPLQTGEGTIFRARLGNLTQAQAQEACRHFRDCLPLPPR
ncbi:MAG: D-alanyl-D-alanine carboxypeptidase family protein [Micavibrio sp.]